jgi:formamidopyrimidine-DNA glycosylase
LPELPEVQTIVDGLSQQIIGKTVQSCNVIRENLIQGNCNNFVSFFANRKVNHVFRRGKFLIFQFDDTSRELLVHLRMSGKFVISSKQVTNAYDRILFQFSDQSLLIYNDVRCFGTLELIEDWKLHPSIQKLGVEPLDKKFSTKFLQEKLTKKNTAIKTFLLDQTIIAGLGNIYVAEILFDSRIHPTRGTKTITFQEAQKLIRSTKKILRLALEKNGTSISDFRRVDDKTGEFQDFLKVYGKEKKACPRCTSLIQRIKQQQRSSYFCSQCQV